MVLFYSFPQIVQNIQLIGAWCIFKGLANLLALPAGLMEKQERKDSTPSKQTPRPATTKRLLFTYFLLFLRVKYQGSRSHGKSGKVMEKFVVIESLGKVMENNKNVKSHGKFRILP